MASPVEIDWFHGFSFDTHKRPKMLRALPTDYVFDDEGRQIIYQRNGTGGGDERQVDEAVTYTHDDGGIVIHREDTDDSVIYPNGGYRFTYYPLTKEYLCELEPHITIPQELSVKIPTKEANHIIGMIDEMYPTILLNNRPNDPGSSLVELTIGPKKETIFEARSHKAEIFRQNNMTIDWKVDDSYYHILARSATTLEIPSAFGSELYRVHMDARIQSSTNRDFVLGEIGKFADKYLLSGESFDSLACATVYFEEIDKKTLWSGYIF